VEKLSSNFGVLFQHVQFVFLNRVKLLLSGTRYFTAAVFVCMGNSSHPCSGGSFTVPELRKRSKQVELKLLGDICLWEESMALENPV